MNSIIEKEKKLNQTLEKLKNLDLAKKDNLFIFLVKERIMARAVSATSSTPYIDCRCAGC